MQSSILLTDCRWARTHLTVIVRRHAGGYARVLEGRVGRPGARAVYMGDVGEYSQGKKQMMVLKAMNENGRVGTCVRKASTRKRIASEHKICLFFYSE